MDSSGDAVLSSEMKGLYVLYIEDDLLVRKSTEALFREYGVLYESSKSLEELMLKLPALERMPDIVLTDFSLSENHTAIDVVKAVAAEFDENIPAIVLTGDSGESAPIQEMEAVTILRKPLSAALLLNEIRRLCLRLDGGPSS